MRLGCRFSGLVRNFRDSGKSRGGMLGVTLFTEKTLRALLFEHPAAALRMRGVAIRLLFVSSLRVFRFYAARKMF